MSLPLIVFARPPVPGATKTRLEPALGPIGAATLYRAFLHDVVARVKERFVPQLWIAGNIDHPELHFPALHGLVRHRQPDGDIGERMRHALGHTLRTSPGALLMGSDAPTFPIRLLEEARELLARHDFVLTPSADGGFPLIGARRPLRFGAGVRWSTRDALANTFAVLREQGSVGLTSPWYDVDTPDDLRLLRAELSLAPWRAPRTAEVLLRSSAPR